MTYQDHNTTLPPGAKLCLDDSNGPELFTFYFEAGSGEGYRAGEELWSMLSHDPSYCVGCEAYASADPAQDDKDLLIIMTLEQVQLCFERLRIEKLKAGRRFTDPTPRRWSLLYPAYLQSQAWDRRRNKVLARDGNICTACGDAQATEVHHLTYERVGREPLFDLVSVCKSCHESIHRKLVKG